MKCKMRLLDRLGEGIALTDAGQRALPRAMRILAERDHLHAELADLRGMQTGRLRLGLPVLGSSVLFAPLVAAYRQRYPGIEIDLREQGSADLEALVRSGEIEMGATLAPVPEDLDSQLVVDDSLVALLPEGHPLSSKSGVKFKELAQSPFILFEKGFVLNALLTKACRKRGIALNVAGRGAHADFIIALVAAGLGVSLLPRLVVESRGNLSIPVVPIEDKDIRWKLGLIWRRGVALSPAAQRWLSLVKERRP